VPDIPEMQRKDAKKIIEEELSVGTS